MKTWTGLSGDPWASASDWTPSGPPAAGDDVAITGRLGTEPGSADAYAKLGGPGSAASLSLFGNVALSGTFDARALFVGDADTPAALLLAASRLATASLIVLNGEVRVSGAGATLTVAGGVTLGGVRRDPASFAANALTLAAGARLQAGSLALSPSSLGVTDVVAIDDASSLEVGTAGSAAAGKLTIDAGRTLSGAGVVSASRGILNQGTVLAQGGALILSSVVSGTGQLRIADGATLSLTSAAGASTAPVAFLGAAGTLSIGRYASNIGAAGTGLNQQGVISGFVRGDTIHYGSDGTISAVRYQAGAAGTGTGSLTLISGATTVGYLTLAGSYAASSFQVTPGIASGYDIVLAASTPGPGPAGPGTAAPDPYRWSAGGSGSWTNAAAWTDLAAPGPSTPGSSTPGPSTPGLAGVAPGRNNPVTIANRSATGYQVVTGPGDSSSLTLLGSTTLDGAFATGALAVGAADTPGALSLAAGTTLAAATATLLYGPLQATGIGTRLSVAGAVTLGGPRAYGTAFSANVLAVNAGAALRAGGLVLVEPASGGTSNAVIVDAESSVEIGVAGTAAAGTLTVDPGRVVAGSGSLSAAGGIVNGGTILAQGGALRLSSPVSGPGTLQIGAGATLALLGTRAASTAPVSFAGPGGTLQVAAAADGLSAQGPISGFLPGDVINYAGDAAITGAITGATYRPGGDGRGTLSLTGSLTGSLAGSLAGSLTGGGAVVGTLTLAGAYDGYRFQVTPAASYGYDVRITFADPLFDSAYYLSRYADVKAAGADPYQHYMQYGWREGRDPDPLFSTRYYLANTPGLAASGANPLLDFEQGGWQAGRNPSAAFSLGSYLSAYPDVKAAGINPLLHFLTVGQAQGRASFPVVGPADPGVNAAYYYATYADVRTAGIDAGAHYHASGAREGRNPNAWFDTRYYLAQNPDVAAAGADPLLHYEQYGWREGREPSLLFSDRAYLATYADIRAAGVNPLLHYIGYGKAEGRVAALPGGDAPADPLVDAAYYDTQLGATLIPAGAAGARQAAWSYDASGWQRGLDPDAWFDTKYYLAHNPDVAAAHVNPLLHYEGYGWREGRDPSAGFSVAKYLGAYADVRAAGIEPLQHYVLHGQAEGRVAFAA